MTPIADGALQRRKEARRFRLTLTGLALMLAVLLGSYLLLEKSQGYDPTVAGGRVVLYAVLLLNILLVLALVATLFRNLFKLFFEWRRDILGSRFAIKLVTAFLALGIVPAALLFFAGSEIIRFTTAKWFSTDVDQVTDAALRIVVRHREEMDHALEAKARALSEELSKERLLALERRPEIVARLRRQLSERGVSGIAVFPAGAAPLEVLDTRLALGHPPEIPDALVTRWRRGERFVDHQELRQGRGSISRIGAPVTGASGEVLGAVVVASLMDASVARDEALVTSARAEYKRKESSRSSIVASNVSILMLVTLLLLFGAVWVGLLMARGVTVPIQRLAEGTRAVSMGDLDHRVKVAASDELDMLVRSFNEMTSQLKSSKAALELSVGELRRSNDALLERRVFIEAVLDNVAAGVLTFDREGRLTTTNPAAGRLLRLPGSSPGRPLSEALPGGDLEPLRALVAATLSGQGPQGLEVAVLAGAGERTLQALTTPLLSPRDGSLTGVVLLVEDVSELSKAQKASAWREVARRMAHEIKNPLTPIQLSAERVLMKVQDIPVEPRVAEALRDCARIILEEVRTLKSLVDEFSRFARLPQVALRPASLDEVVKSALQLYESVAPPGRIRLDLDPSIPLLPLDPEQMKRAIVNLVDNALQAMGNEGTVTIRTSLEPERLLVCLAIADEGPGIPEKDRPKLFLPHFSTKKRGTGLGLAIVDRVVADHGGYIRLEDNVPQGARFVIELPLRRTVAVPVP